MKVLLIATAVIAWVGIWFSSASAQEINNQAQITFTSFLGTYNLSRDSKGVSLLTTEETILADFPASGNFYGLTRKIPNTYQGRDVDLKVTSVVDATGNQIQFSARNDSSGNLIVRTGDPKIILFGPQTIKIRYQTRGVINLDGQTNQFLLNTNGLGWDQPFGVINAVVNISKSLQSELAGEPSCYINTGKSKSDNCEVQSLQKTDSTEVTAKASQLPAHQALVIDMTFGPSSFNPYNAPSNNKFLIIIPVAAFVGLIITFIVKRKKGTS